ncbi:hypothetical protein LP416_23560 [Polaromonas sp. P2-4]|nr:hypothetical protein LP416_23560 [Polaromonas sp. P2-4]
MSGRNLLSKHIVPLALAAVVSQGVTAEGKGLTIWSFDEDEIGKAPVSFEFAVTAKKQPGKWVIAKDGDNHVLAQEDRDKTARRFTMALVKNSAYKDLKISVRAKPVAGEVEMVAGAGLALQGRQQLLRRPLERRQRARGPRCEWRTAIDDAA